MHTFEYGTTTIKYILIKSKRKNITVTVETNGAVLVKAPEPLSEEEILQAVKKKAYWIVQQLFLMKDIKCQQYHRQYVNGESFLYMGRRYSLLFEDDAELKKPVVKLVRGKFLIRTNNRDEKIVHDSMVRWYTERAQEVISKRIQYYEKYFPERKGKIVIKDQKKRWASCNKAGDLMFNWKIIMAPSNIIDYVIVHEMCHLKHLNHSKVFWEELGRILLDYKDRKEWLMNRGIELEL